MRGSTEEAQITAKAWTECLVLCPDAEKVGKSTNFIPALAGEGIAFNLFGLTVHLADPNASGVKRQLGNNRCARELESTKESFAGLGHGVGVSDSDRSACGVFS